MQRLLRSVAASAVEGNSWKKLASPTAGRGKTAFPKDPAEQKRLGIRYDYDGEVTKTDGVYHKFQMQVNAGDGIPSTLKQWRAKNGGTHAVMANVYVKKDGTKEDVEAALAAAHSEIEGI